MRRSAIGGVAVVISVASTAHAGDVKVEIEGCGDVNVAEVERLLAIDLAQVLEERKGAPFPPVRVECAAGKMRIVVTDPVTAKKLERELPAPKPNEKGKERTLALAISQLFLTSWLELVLPDPPEPVGPPKQAQGSVAAKAIAKRTVVAELAPSWETILVVATRFRPSTRGLGDVAGLARPAVSIGSGFRTFALLGWEVARTSRTRGEVEATLGALGLGIGFRSSRVGPLSFDASLAGALVWTRLEGRPLRDDVIGSRGSGSAVELTLSLGPTLSSGPFRLGLEAQLGVLGPRIVGQVMNEDSVRMSGLFFGAGASFGLAFGGAE